MYVAIKIEKALHSNHSHLSPGSSRLIALVNKKFYEDYLKTKGCSLKISYIDRYSEWHAIRVVFYQYMSIVIDMESMESREQPGFLLSIPSYIDMIKTYLPRKIKRSSKV